MLHTNDTQSLTLEFKLDGWHGQWRATSGVFDGRRFAVSQMRIASEASDSHCSATLVGAHSDPNGR